MSDNRRLDDLKRRVQQDPASIAVAALADEYRRLGLFHDAIETCRAGLLRHPAYLSARVTLGRALLELGEYDEAETQLEQVVRTAPDNLAAIRALADIHHKRGDAPDGYTADPQSAPAAAPDPVLPAPHPVLPAPVPAALAFAPAPTDNQGAAAPARVVVATRAGEVAPALQVESHMAPREIYVPPIDPACERLEQFLAAIDRARDALELAKAHGSH